LAPASEQALAYAQAGEALCFSPAAFVYFPQGKAGLDLTLGSPEA
jgi:hypothetical protein